MLEFVCNSCNKPARIERYYSGYTKWCRSCYLKRAGGKARQPNGKYARLRYTVKKKGLPFDITFEEFLRYQNEDCHYCGLPVIGWSSVEKADNTGSGLDRKDSRGGYTKDNVVPACFLCNRTKNSWFSYDEMLVLGKVIRQIIDKRQS